MGPEQTSPSGHLDPVVSARQDQHHQADRPALGGQGVQLGRASRSSLRPLRRPDHGRTNQQAAPRSSALALAADVVDSTRWPEPQPGEGGMDTARLIARGDLLATLDRAAAGKVTIISAPAGSGKTSLLRAWADRPDRAHRIAFVQVQHGQQDAQLFWLALLNAVRHASGTTSDTEPPTATPDFNVRTLVDRVLSELADHHGRFVLVIDDLHELKSPEALAQLTHLLTNLPPNAHAILTTRRDLRLRLHRLRLAGELAEIRAADLRFSQRETRELLDASGTVLSEARTALLHQRTEGWAAGLRLAAISLAGHPDPERFVAEFSGSDRTVADYLLAEMLERQPDDVQQLLLRTSLLDRVNGELADLLTGRPGSERILLELEDANAFVVSLDPGAHVVPLPPPVRGSAPAGAAPEAARRRGGAAPAGRRMVHPVMARWPTPSGTPRRRATGPLRPGCSPTIRSASRSTARRRPSRRWCGPSRREPAGITPSWPWCAQQLTSSRDGWTRRPPTWRSPRRTPRRRRRIASPASRWRSRR